MTPALDTGGGLWYVEDMKINHSSCNHDSTPAARRNCRARRNDMLKATQAAFMDYEMHRVEDGSEYFAMVETLAFHFGISLDEAYELVENGPVA